MEISSQDRSWTDAGMRPIFLNANHGKRGISIDIKRSKGRTVLLDLRGATDVFVTNMRSDAVGRLGLRYSQLAECDPGLVYCTLPGFGSAGSYRNFAAYEDVIQAISGIAAVQGGAGEPQYARSPIADKTVALLALGAINAALFLPNE